MQTAMALGDAPLPVSATSLDPYGQLIKMLLPRAQSIVVYDRMGVCIWESDGVEGPDLLSLMQGGHDDDAPDEASADGYSERLHGGQTAYIFTLRDESLDAAFLEGAEARGLSQLKGHRSVGGMRASIYNAMPIDGVAALVEYMEEFRRRRA